MIVSLAVFMMVAVIATGSLLKIVDAGKKAQATKAVVNNLQYALESMSREMRMGKKFHCNTEINPDGNELVTPRNCPDGSDPNFYLAFEPSTSRGGVNSLDRFAYRFVVDAERGKIQKADTNDGGITNWFDVTAPEVDIEDMRFVVTGSGAESGQQEPAKIIIILRGYAGVKDRLRSDFNLQTTITQRIRE